jgi:predicted dehydrogenase
VVHENRTRANVRSNSSRPRPTSHSTSSPAVRHIVRMKTFNVGVIGHGWVATAHIPAINATGKARVTAIYSTRPLNDAELSHKYGGPVKCYQDFGQFLAHPGLDAVSICSFPKDHARHFIAAARAGKHIIVEKPLALSWKDCQAIATAAKLASIQVCVCFEVRYSSQFLTVKAAIDQGLVGDVHYAEVDYFHGVGPWYGQFRWSHQKAEAGSSLLSAGCHALDALLLVMGGAEPAEVTSYAVSSKSEYFAPYDFPTTQINVIRFKDGRIGKTTSCLDCIQPYYFHTHVVGSHGSILDNKFHSTKLGALNKHKWSELSCPPVDSGDVKDHPYQAQFEAFFGALAEGLPMKLTSIDDALATHKLIFAADKSAATGKPVKLA